MWHLFQKRTTKWVVSHDLVIRFNKTLQMNVITFTTSNGGACEQAFCRVPSVDLGIVTFKREKERGGGELKIFHSPKTISQTGRGDSRYITLSMESPSFGRLMRSWNLPGGIKLKSNNPNEMEK